MVRVRYASRNKPVACGPATDLAYSSSIRSFGSKVRSSSNEISCLPPMYAGNLKAQRHSRHFRSSSEAPQMLLIVSQLRGYGRAVCKTFLDLLLTLVCGPLLPFQILAVEIFPAKPSISPNHFLRFKPPSEFHGHPEVAREAQSRREKPGVDWGGARPRSSYRWPFGDLPGLGS